MAYFDIKILMIAFALLVLAFLCVRYRKKTLVPLALAFAIAFLWSTYFRYEYNGSNVLLFDRINIYPFILWTVGLTVLRFVSYELRSHRLAYAIVLYLMFLLAAEAVGYHLLNIRLNSNYTSLLNLGIIHAPTTMKIFYIFAGPAYLLLLDRLNHTQALKTAQPR